MRLRDVAFLLVFALASTNASAQSKPTIGSTSLCGDGYLQAIAPESISALSWQSRSPLSRASDDLKPLPQLWDDPEILAASKPDIILFGAGEGSKTSGLIKAQERLSLQLKWGEDFQSVFDNMEMVGQALNQNDHSTGLISNLEARLSDLKTRAQNRPTTPKILYLSRSGGSAGTGTLVDAAITAAGGQNALNTPGWITLDTEALIGLNPDLIVTSFFRDGYESVNASGIRHRAVRKFLNRHDRLDVPGNLWPCAGPALIEAAELIADKLDDGA